jgi:hypothetical protein
MSAEQDIEAAILVGWTQRNAMMAKARPSLSGRLRKLNQPSSSTRRTIAAGP